MTESAPDEEALLCDLEQFRAYYRGVHGYLGLFVCIFGLVANILNIIVLTRKDMNGSPINRILTGEMKKICQAVCFNLGFQINDYL